MRRTWGYRETAPGNDRKRVWVQVTPFGSRAGVRVRLARADEVPALAELILHSGATLGVFGRRATRDAEDADLPRLENRVRAGIDEPDRVLLVAVDDADSLLGMMSCRADEVGGIDMTPVLHVTHLLVPPSHRRHGVGRALLAAAVRVADERGVEHVLATVGAGSREGNRYLARIGFTPTVVHRIASTATLHRSLGMSDATSRLAVLRRARTTRANRSGLSVRPLGRNA